MKGEKLRFRAKALLSAGTIVALAVALPLAPAYAASSSDVQYENDLGLLVTPAELQALGADSQAVAAQSDLFAGLSASELSEQASLRHSQEESAEMLASQPDVPVPSPEASKGGVSTNIYITACWPGNDYYSVYWSNFSGNVVDCFADSGTYVNTTTLTNTYAVRPGNNVGRVYYPSGGYYYWSPWRGKSMDSYYFNGTVNVQRVQIQ